MKEPLHLFNTLTRSKEEFTPIQPGKVGLYTCGPTVYHFAHIGNLRTYIFEDILRRTLEHNHYEVNHVMNITDVGHLTSDGDTGDDKMEAGAAREHKTVWEVADFYTKAFMDDMHALHILPATTICKATDHIPEQIAMVQTLTDKGFTYQTSDGVYFDTSKLSDYGKLAKLDATGLEEGARVDMGEKKNATDFALWKFSPAVKPGEATRQMEWEAPWPAAGSMGFPGWHIECSAMSMKYLGEHFDIHCGGIDHIPVHHTNEIAQNEAAVGHQTVNVWMHGEFLLTNDERNQESKMSKSKDNFLTLDSLVEKGFDPIAYRYFALGGHYRSKLNFTFEALEGASIALKKIQHAVSELARADAKPTEIDTEVMERFNAAMNNDLDTPKALAIVWEVVRGEMEGGKKTATLFAMDQLLGLGMAEWFDATTIEQAEIPTDVVELAMERETARQAKEWSTADDLRDQIAARGYTVEDTPNGPRLLKSDSINS